MCTSRSGYVTVSIFRLPSITHKQCILHIYPFLAKLRIHMMTDQVVYIFVHKKKKLSAHQKKKKKSCLYLRLQVYINPTYIKMGEKERERKKKKMKESWSNPKQQSSWKKREKN